MRPSIDASALEAILALVRAVAREEIERALAERAAPEEYLTCQEAAAVAKVHYRTIRRWADDGKLQRQGSGRLLRVLRSDLERYMRECGRKRPGNEVSPEQQARRDFG